MKSEEHIKMMLVRWKTLKRKAFKYGNDSKYKEACTVTRTLKIILEIKLDMK